MEIEVTDLEELKRLMDSFKRYGSLTEIERTVVLLADECIERRENRTAPEKLLDAFYASQVAGRALTDENAGLKHTVARMEREKAASEARYGRISRELGDSAERNLDSRREVEAAEARIAAVRVKCDEIMREHRTNEMCLLCAATIKATIDAKAAP